MEINPSISLNPILGEKTAGILNRGIAAQRLLKHIRQQGEAHLGLRYFADPRPDILSLLALNEPLVVFCAAHSRFITEEPTEPAALRGIPWVTYPLNEGSSGEPFARLLKQQLLRHDLQSDERIVIDSLTAQKRLIEADFGIGLLPASSIEEELQLGALRVLPIDALRQASRSWQFTAATPTSAKPPACCLQCSQPRQTPPRSAGILPAYRCASGMANR